MTSPRTADELEDAIEIEDDDGEIDAEEDATTGVREDGAPEGVDE